MSSKQGCGCSILIIALLNLLVVFLIIISAISHGLSLISFIVLLTVLCNAGVFFFMGLRIRKNPSLIAGGGEEGEKEEDDDEGNEEDVEGEEGEEDEEDEED